MTYVLFKLPPSSQKNLQKCNRFKTSHIFHLWLKLEWGTFSYRRISVVHPNPCLMSSCSADGDTAPSPPPGKPLCILQFARVLNLSAFFKKCVCVDRPAFAYCTSSSNDWFARVEEGSNPSNAGRVVAEKCIMFQIQRGRITGKIKKATNNEVKH